MRARAPRCGAIMTERRDHGRQGRQERQGKEQAAAVEETGSAGSGEAGQGPATDQQQVTDQRRWVSEPEVWVPGETTVLRDAKGFVLTGRDLLANAAYARIWKERR